MELLTSDALVMHQMDWSESSRIVTFFTEQYGLIKLIARSIKKKNNKFQGVIEPCQFVHITFDYKASRQLNYLKEADIIQDNQKLVEHLNAYYGFLSMIELTNKTVHAHDAQPLLYKEFFQFNHHITKHDSVKISIIRFMLKFMDHMGYQINVKSCSNCGNSELEHIQFDIKTGLRCQNCLYHHIENEFSPQMYQLLVYVDQTEYSNLSSEISDNQLFFSTVRLLLLYLSYHIDKQIQLNSLSFIT